MKFSPKKYIEQLESLGNKPEDIARSLKGRGYKGIRGKSDACPLANFIKAAFKVTPNVSGDNLIVNQREDWGQVTTEVAHPNPVHDFIMNFDKGDYPELEESI